MDEFHLHSGSLEDIVWQALYAASKRRPEESFRDIYEVTLAELKIRVLRYSNPPAVGARDEWDRS